MKLVTRHTKAKEEIERFLGEHRKSPKKIPSWVPASKKDSYRNLIKALKLLEQDPDYDKVLKCTTKFYGFDIKRMEMSCCVCECEKEELVELKINGWTIGICNNCLIKAMILIEP